MKPPRFCRDRDRDRDRYGDRDRDRYGDRDRGSADRGSRDTVSRKRDRSPVSYQRSGTSGGLGSASNPLPASSSGGFSNSASVVPAGISGISRVAASAREKAQSKAALEAARRERLALVKNLTSGEPHRRDSIDL